MKFPFPGRSLSRVQSFRRREYRFLWARDPHCLCGFLVDKKKKKEGWEVEEEEERIKSKEIGRERAREREREEGGQKTTIVGSTSLSNGFCFSYISPPIWPRDRRDVINQRHGSGFELNTGTPVPLLRYRRLKTEGKSRSRVSLSR